MQNFFNPQSITIIGASDKKGKIGNILLENLEKGGYKGKIYPINPKHKKIGKFICYGKLSDVKEEIDLAIVAIPAQFVPKIIEECAWHIQPIKNIVIISAGFSESGREGVLLEAKIKNLAKEYRLNIIGPNCLGLINTGINLNASFAKTNVKKGQVGLVMQSGALTTALIDLAENNNFGFSLIATLGNKTLLDEVDFVDYLLKDENTKIVVFYLETIKRGQEFIKKVSALAKEKPVFILKTGSSQKVQAAIQSHTGSMAGEFEVAKKAIEKCGAVYFDNIAELTYTLKFFSGFKLPVGKKTVIITNAGGPGVITADLIEKTKNNIEILDLNENLQKEIMKILTPACSAKNPIDVLGDADSRRYENVFKKLSKNKAVGSVLALITPQAQTEIEEIARVTIATNKKYFFPILPVFIGGPASDLADKILLKAGFCNFNFPAEALSALRKATEHILKKINVEKEAKINSARQKKAGEILNEVVKNSRKGFYYREAIQLAELYGIKSEKAFYLKTEKDLAGTSKMGFPLVIKIDDPAILHKNANAGVILNINNASELKKAFSSLKKQFKDSEIIVQKQLLVGMEIILGIKKDPAFGMAVLCGLGGIFAEIINEKNIWITPVSEEEIEKELKQSVIGKIFEKNNLKLSQLVKEIKKIAELAEENSQIKELDINPLFFYKDREPMAVDIKGLIE